MKSKDDLIQLIKQFQNSNDVEWELYFCKTNFRDRNPYFLTKKRWKCSRYIQSYSKNLLDCVLEYQFDKVTEVESYKGNNPKVACDYISNESELVKDNIQHLLTSVKNSSDENPRGKYNGYIVIGHENRDGSTLALVRKANPIVKFDKKGRKTATFRETEEGNLEAVEEDYYKLYYTTDFLICSDGIYTFNLKFEDFFHLKKTMKNFRDKVVDKLVSQKIFSDDNVASKKLRSLTPRKFLSVNEKRIAELKDVDRRKKICEDFEIKIDDHGKIVLDEQDAHNFLNWICYKSFKEADTNNKIRANQAELIEK